MYKNISENSKQLNIDFKQINYSALQNIYQIVVNLLPTGKQEGNEWVARNPNRYDQSFGSFKINLTTGLWGDFATGDKGGDITSLVAYLNNWNQYDSAKWLSECIGMQSYSEPKPQITKEIFKPLPTSADTIRPFLTEYEHVAEYTNEIGETCCYICRKNLDEIDKETGKYKKNFYPKTYGSLNDQAPKWHNKHIPDQRPLYRLYELVNQLHKPVLVVEGEKTADMAVKLFGDQFCITTSIGGSNAIDKTNWNHLSNRDVYLWPDNDPAGYQIYAQSVISKIIKIAQSVRQVEVPNEFPAKWDLADILPAGVSIGNLWNLLNTATHIDNKKNFKNRDMSLPKPLKASNASYFQNENQIYLNWEEIISLPSIILEIENMTPDMVPEPWRDWIVSNCKEFQVPLEMMFIPALTALSGLVGRRLGIFPKSKSGWIVIPNLWCMLVADPSVKKTPVLKKIMEFIIEIEKEKQKQNAIKMKEYKTELRAFERSQKHSNTKNLEEPIKPKEDRLYISDVTTEKIAMIASENPNGLIYFRDELAGHFKEFEMSGRESSRTSFLEYYNGDGFVTIDRVSRESITTTTSIAIIGGFTTDGFQECFSKILSTSSSGDGLLPRYQMGICPTKLKTFTLVDEEPNTEANERVGAIFHNIHNQNFTDPNLELEISKSGIPAIRCDESGQKILHDWLQKHGEKMVLSDDTETPLMVSHLGKNDKLVVSLSLLLHLIKYFDPKNQNDKKNFKIGEESVSQAIRLRDYLELHTRKLYGATAKPALILAHKIVEKIKNGKIYNGMPTAEFHKKDWSKLKISSDTKPIFKILEEHNYIRIRVVNTGGRPSEVIEINPILIPQTLTH